MAFLASKGLRMYLVLDNFNEKKVLLQSLTKLWVKFLRPESTRHQRKINYKKLNFSIFIISYLLLFFFKLKHRIGKLVGFRRLLIT